MKKSYLIFIALLLTIVACKSGIFSTDNSGDKNKLELDYTTGFIAPDSVPVLSESELGISKAVTGFGLKFFGRILEERSGESTLFSPLSLSLSLSMCLSGAEGDTMNQLSVLMGLEGKDKEEVMSFFKKMLGRLSSLDDRITFNSANAIWYDSFFPIKSAFIKSIGENFDASAFKMDFDDNQLLVDAVNKWAVEKTEGTISRLLEKSPSKPLLLANALYFKAGWGVKFSDSLEKRDFFGANGVERVDFFKGTNDYAYSSLDGYQVLLLPYGQNGETVGFEMAVILPEDGISIQQTLSWLTGKGSELLDNMVTSGRKTRVHVEMPCFKIENSLNDIQGIVSVDCPIPFSPESADFSGISDERIFISKIAQKAYINVDNKGTEASAVTEIGLESTSLGEPQPDPILFRADRPFIFLIRDRGTGNSVFIGVKQ